MANFAPSTNFEARGFDRARYQLTMPLAHARYVNIDGGGPSGEMLNVTSENPSVAKVILWGYLTGSQWSWKVMAIGGGTTRLRGELADGRDYSSPLPVTVTAGNDRAIMETAWRCSRNRLSGAITKLENLISSISALGSGTNGSQPLQNEDGKVMALAMKWLKCPNFRMFPTDNSNLQSILERAARIMRRNLALTQPGMFHVPAGFHASTYGSIDRGFDCGDRFFNHDGPNCRCDVVTHELFHLLNVGHGGQPLNGPTIRELVDTPEKALDSADNLAQLSAELMGSKTDACTRVND